MAYTDEYAITDPYSAAAAQACPHEPFDMYSYSQYPWVCINGFMLVWLTAHIVWFFLDAKSEIFHKMSVEKQRNTVTYVLQILVTTVAFVAQCYGGHEILFQFKDLTELEHPDRLKWLPFSLLCIAVLYVFELCYRSRFGWPLLLHHVITLLLIQLIAVTLHEQQETDYMRLVLVVAFYATVERTSFIALLLHRFGYRWWAQLFFRIAFYQTATIKTFVFCACAIYFIRLGGMKGVDDDYTRWDRFWTISFIPLLIALYAAQLFAIKILWALGSREYKDIEKGDVESGSETMSTGDRDDGEGDNLDEESWDGRITEDMVPAEQPESIDISVYF